MSGLLCSTLSALGSLGERGILKVRAHRTTGRSRDAVACGLPLLGNEDKIMLEAFAYLFLILWAFIVCGYLIISAGRALS